jgi:hypothetical protein
LKHLVIEITQQQIRHNRLRDIRMIPSSCSPACRLWLQEHADLLPHVEMMKCLNPFGVRKRKPADAASIPGLLPIPRLFSSRALAGWGKTTFGRSV